MNTKVLKKINQVFRPSQNIVDEKIKNSVEDLKKHGFIVLENFIDEKNISKIQEFVNSKLDDLDFDSF